ncbi:MAG: hypothetical protein ABL958_21025 [Bdellovibrionia bacterium]
MAERVFRVLSLAFLSIGFVVAVAGADRDGAQDLANATTVLIQHVDAAKEANTLNATTQSNKGISLTSETGFIATAKVEVSDEEAMEITAKPPAKAPGPQLPPQTN